MLFFGIIIISTLLCLYELVIVTYSKSGNKSIGISLFGSISMVMEKGYDENGCGHHKAQRQN